MFLKLQEASRLAKCSFHKYHIYCTLYWQRTMGTLIATTAKWHILQNLNFSQSTSDWLQTYLACKNIIKADRVQSKPNILKVKYSSKPKKTTSLRHKWHHSQAERVPISPGRQQDWGALTVGGDSVGLPWGRIGSVGSSLLDARAVLSLPVRCHGGEGWHRHDVGIMSAHNDKTEGFKASITVQDLLEQSRTDILLK